MNQRHRLQEAMRDGMAWTCILIAFVVLTGVDWDTKTATTTIRWIGWSMFAVFILLLVAMMVNSGRISREEERDEWRRK